MKRLGYVIAVLLGAATGCVEQPAMGLAPQCETSSDCDQASGEICDEGICWGDPPTSVTFAAVLAPPDERDDLAVTEIPMMPIARDGMIDNLNFKASMVVTGRVLLACDSDNPIPGCGEESSIAARITFERPSRIPGVPSFKRSVDAAAGFGPDAEPAFRVRLPVLEEGERYDVTITPDAVAGEEGLLDPAEVAPPSRITIAATSEVSGIELTIGSPNALKRITGRIRTEFSEPDEGVEGMQVFARGRWSAEGPLVRASNLATTGPTGTFELLVPLAMEDTFEIVARPTGETPAPTLSRSDVVFPDPPIPVDEAEPLTLEDLVVPPAPNASPFVVTVAGTSPSGEEVDIAGAQVSLATVLAPAAGDTATVSTYTASGTTAADGTVELQLYPGSEGKTREYTMQVLPPPESFGATLFAQTVEVAGVPSSGRGFLQKVTLASRTPMSGTVVTAAGDEIEEASVSVSASRLFRTSLGSEEQAIVDALSYPATLTNGDGGFVVWVDPIVSATPAIYDLEMIPPAEAMAPRWTEDAVQVASTEGTHSLGTIALPPASWARGVVRAGGEAVGNAEIRIYQIDSNASLCEQLALTEDSGCEPTARLRGIWRSDDDGWVAIVVPDIDDL